MPTASSPSTSPSITRFARAMEFVLNAVLILIPLGLGVLAFGFSEHLPKEDLLTGLEVAPGALAFPWTFAAFLVLLITSAPLLYATNAARLMFGRFRHGEIFTPLTARRIQQIALGLLGQAFIESLGSVALSAVYSGAGKASGLVLNVSSDQLWIALFAFIFLGLAKVMRSAALLAEDNAAIV